MYGSTSMWCGGGSPTLSARHNRWESNLYAQPTYNDNYKLWVHNCSPFTPVIVKDTLPAYLTCFMGPPVLLDDNLDGNANQNINTETNLPLVNLDGVQMPLDEAVNQLSSQLIEIESEENYRNLIFQYSTIIENCNLFEDAEVNYWQNIAYVDVHKFISDFYKFVDYDKTNVNFNAGVEELISINTSLLENPLIPHYKFVEYSLDIALLNRMREHYTVSISQLESLTNELQFAGSESEYDYVQNWLCHIKAEKLATEGMLTPDEFEFAIENCDLCFSVRNAETSDTINNSDNHYEKAKNDIINHNTENNFTISPNPNQGSFNIEFANSCLGCEIRIINSIGQLVKSVVVGSDEKTIKIDGLTTGHYKVICLLNNEIIDTGTVVVK
ncbi:MAG: T9SS type A sorting domain-containing protein [Bacteroidales bacterium]|nr:T9SS type A sorting domain-containing protein [Bacteroidales bacterium]